MANLQKPKYLVKIQLLSKTRAKIKIAQIATNIKFLKIA